jgi:hypothetical protein
MEKMSWNEVDLILGIKKDVNKNKYTQPPASRNELYQKLLNSLSLQKRTIDDEDVFIIE